MTYDESHIRQWLEGMRRCAGRDADRATLLLDLLDEWEGVQEERDELVALIEAEGLSGGKPGEQLVIMLEQYGAVREICEDAGLIEYGDDETDILPLLRMFIPPATI